MADLTLKRMTSYPFRVFISYSHMDSALATELAQALEDFGLHPLWDKHISPGTPFTDSIKDMISRSHLFISVITPNSQLSHWVHQETGYALALNIPVLPITLDDLPQDMMASLQAVKLNSDLSDLAECLQKIDLEKLVVPAPHRPHGIIEVVDESARRAEMIVSYAGWVKGLGSYGKVRYKAVLTSFSIPNNDPNDPIWQDLYENSPRSEHERQLERQERQVLEEHARIAGCRLIIDPTFSTLNVTSGLKARKARLETLLGFISTMKSNMLQVVISTTARGGNLLIMGDHFFAESHSPRREGYRQTFFNSHPPTVLQKLHQFDLEFDGLKKASGSKTLKQICAELQQIINGL